MQTFVGVLLVVAGAAMFVLSSRAVLRANPGVLVPYLRNPENLPGAAIALRAAGGGTVVFGVGLLAAVTGFWGALIVVAALLPGLVLVVLHNRRFAAGD